MAIRVDTKQECGIKNLGNVLIAINLNVAHAAILRVKILRQCFIIVMFLISQKVEARKTIKKLKAQVKATQESTHQLVTATPSRLLLFVASQYDN